MQFIDRKEAGQALAQALHEFAQDNDAIVIGLPRGGVVVAHEVAKALDLPLDITCPRKIGAPFNKELAIGAITESGQGVIDSEMTSLLEIPDSYIKEEMDRERAVASRRMSLYRKGKPPRQLKGKTAILVDDGLATGATMKAAIQTMRDAGAKRIIVAVPVAPAETVTWMRSLADAITVLNIPPNFQAIGQFYINFPQVEDSEVIALLSS